MGQHRAWWRVAVLQNYSCRRRGPMCSVPCPPSPVPCQPRLPAAHTAPPAQIGYSVPGGPPLASDPMLRAFTPVEVMVVVVIIGVLAALATAALQRAQERSLARR